MYAQGTEKVSITLRPNEYLSQAILDTSSSKLIPSNSHGKLTRLSSSISILSSTLTISFPCSKQSIQIPLKLTLTAPILSLSNTHILYKPCGVGQSRLDYLFLMNSSSASCHWSIQSVTSAVPATDSGELVVGAENVLVCDSALVNNTDPVTVLKDSGLNNDTVTDEYVDDPDVFSISELTGILPGPCVSLMSALSESIDHTTTPTLPSTTTDTTIVDDLTAPTSTTTTATVTALPIKRMIQPSWKDNTMTVKDILHKRMAMKLDLANLKPGQTINRLNYPYPLTVTFHPKANVKYRSKYICISEYGNICEFMLEGNGTYEESDLN